jgi:DNA replication protein DnaC
MAHVIKAGIEVCSLCGGTGWKTAPRSPEEDGKASKERRVTRCDCRVRERAQSLLAAARIPKRYEHCELSNFEFDGQYRSLAPARLAAYKFVEEYPVEKIGLLLIGSIGVGKTHLAVGIAKELMRSKGVSCLFYDYRELLKQIQNSYNATVSATELDILRPVFETEVLVLDELGATRPTDWVWDTVSLIINSRYNDKLTTVITTNFPDRQSAEADARQGIKRLNREDTLGDRVGDRMYSRLHEMCRIVEMSGVDFRRTVKSASFA